MSFEGIHCSQANADEQRCFQAEREFYKSWKPQKNGEELKMVRDMYAEVGMKG